MTLIIFLFNNTAATEIYTLSLHDALPILTRWRRTISRRCSPTSRVFDDVPDSRDRKSTRLNSSHSQTSYAVFCLKKKSFILLFLAIFQTFFLIDCFSLLFLNLLLHVFYIH